MIILGCAVCDMQLTTGQDMAPVGYHRVTKDDGEPANIGGSKTSKAFLWYLLAKQSSSGNPPPITGRFTPQYCIFVLYLLTYCHHCTPQYPPLSLCRSGYRIHITMQYVSRQLLRYFAIKKTSRTPSARAGNRLKGQFHI